MCTFITAILGTETDLPQMRQLCEKHGFGTDAMDNVSLRVLMPHGIQFLPVGGSCNCDTALGFAQRTTYQSHDLEHDIRKLKRKGWTTTKIERWRKSKEHSLQQKERQPYLELSRWKAWINEIVGIHTVKDFMIVLHFFKGTLDSEPIQIKRVEKLNIETLSVEQLALLDSDVLYQFTR